MHQLPNHSNSGGGGKTTHRMPAVPEPNGFYPSSHREDGNEALPLFGVRIYFLRPREGIPV